MITLTKTYKPDLSPIADDHKWVYAIIVIGTDTYVYRTSCHEDMTDAHIQALLDEKHDDFVCEVYRAMYHEAEIVQQDKETLLQAWVNGKRAVLSSNKAFSEFMAVMGNDQVASLTIIDI